LISDPREKTESHCLRVVGDPEERVTNIGIAWRRGEPDRADRYGRGGGSRDHTPPWWWCEAALYRVSSHDFSLSVLGGTRPAATDAGGLLPVCRCVAKVSLGANWDNPLSPAWKAAVDMLATE
jgi:hypothetical protein